MQSIKLEKYLDKFVDNGIEDLETILELKDEHIEQIGIPLGHKLKIMKRIKDLRKEKGLTLPQSRQGTERKEEVVPESAEKSQKTSLKNGHYDEGESHNQFLEALNEWRNAKPAPQEKKVTFTEENNIKMMEDHPPRRAAPPSGGPKKVSKKESCWNCYKLYLPTDVTNRLKDGSKCYCSEFCHKKYTIQNSKTC